MLSVRLILTLNIFIVISCYDDLSANKSAFQFNTSSPTSVATNALDRNITTCMQTIMGNTSSEKLTWWYVDLEAIHSVYNIRIQFKDYGEEYYMRQKGRFAGFSLYVSNTTDIHSGFLCHKDGPELPELDFKTNCITHGRYVIFYNERRNIKYPAGYIISSVFTELCEVTVTGCSFSGVYGDTCGIPCSPNCQERRCYIANGTCLGCTPGWKGPHCDKACPAGYHGLKCELKCVRHCKDSEGCNHTSGLCDNGCDDGWTGSDCTTECPSKKFGPDCAHNCSGNCLGDVACNKKTGKCDTGCNAGYTGEFCDTGCENGTFGTECKSQCSGNCLYNVPCNSLNGHCDSGCASGYLDEFCSKTCKSGTYGLNCLHNCSLNCIDGLCNNENGHCICIDGKKGSPYCNEKSKQLIPTIEPVIGTVGASVFLLVVGGIILYIFR